MKRCEESVRKELREQDKLFDGFKTRIKRRERNFMYRASRNNRKLNVFEFALGRTITLSHIRLEMNVEVSLGDILSSHA